MSKQIEFNVEYSPKHELAVEKATPEPGDFEITSESIRSTQNVNQILLSFVHSIIFVFDIENGRSKI